MQNPNPHESSKLPVFVLPSSLAFYADDQSSHKQILTLYNPFDFPLKFTVLCTSPRKYAVIDPKGVVKSSCCVDIVIRHNAINQANYDSVDKFRIQIQEQGSRIVLSKRDVTATLLASKPAYISGSNNAPENEHFEHLPAPTAPLVHSREYAYSRGSSSGGNTGPNLVVIIAGIVSLIALALPTEGQNDARLPTYLHLSMHQKLVAAFTLGLVAMAILKS